MKREIQINSGYLMCACATKRCKHTKIIEREREYIETNLDEY